MISKAINVVRHPEFIKLIAKSVSEEDDLVFRFVRLEYLDDGSLFILYRAEANVILLEIQPSITSESILRSIKKCLDINSQVDILPFLVLICTDKVPLSVKSSLVPHSNYAHRQKLNCTFWAKECVLVSKDEVDFNEEKTTQNLDPLAALALYFSDDEEQILKFQSSGNPTMQFLDNLQ